MTCKTCPHLAAIRAALTPCQACEEAHQGQSFVTKATDYTLAQRIDRRPTTAPAVAAEPPPTGCTHLNPDDEDKLRKAMSSLFGLDPIDLLMVQHLFAGKTLASFGYTLNALVRSIGKYRGAIASRQMAHAKKDALAKAFPAIKAVFVHDEAAAKRGVNEFTVANDGTPQFMTFVDKHADLDPERRPFYFISRTWRPNQGRGTAAGLLRMDVAGRMISRLRERQGW